MEKYGRAKEAVHDNMAHALGMLDTRVTHTHTQYPTLITFPRQQWLGKSDSMLRLYIFVKLPVSLTTYVNLYCLLSFVDTEKRIEHEGRDGNVSGRSVLHTEFWRGILKERDHLEDWMILK